MLQVSTKSTVGVQKILNDDFGNRCVICGGYFDEGICSHRHEKGKTYYILPRRKKIIPFKGRHN